MKTEIAICYGDLSVVRVPWDEKESLSRTGVLSIALIILGQTQRCQSSISHDYYQLIWTDTECCLTGHDGDYGFYSLSDAKRSPDWRFPFIMPANCIEFEGVYVGKEDWQKALTIYADPNGGMF